MAKVGRPSRYKKEYATEVVDYVKANWKEGANFINWGTDRNIPPDTLFEWGLRHKEFSVARETCKKFEIAYWKELLRKAATGHSDDVTETTTVVDLRNVDKDGKVKPKPIKQYTTKRKAKMSVAAIMFALKHLDPDNFGDKAVDKLADTLNKILIEKNEENL